LNSEIEILKRALEKFPVAYLKDHFDLNMSKDQLINHVILTSGETVVRDFIYNNFGMLKQHVYLFELNNAIPSGFNFRGLTIYSDTTTTSGTRIIYTSYYTEHSVYNFATDTKDTIKFLVPCKIVINRNRLAIHLNIQENQPSSYFSDKVRSLGKTIDDKHILENIKGLLPSGTSVTSLDLNRGLKYLWEHDEIDGRFVGRRENESHVNETMDEDKLFKVTYPDKYNEVKTKVLTKLNFRSLNSSILISKFVTKPVEGFVSFNIFPQTITSIDDIIDLILQHN